MTISSEFKEFALKGNVMDLAIGVIIGAAFARLVDSMVGDLIMPLPAELIEAQGWNIGDTLAWDVDSVNGAVSLSKK